jgi:hypothetical protein
LSLKFSDRLQGFRSQAGGLLKHSAKQTTSPLARALQDSLAHRARVCGRQHRLIDTLLLRRSGSIAPVLLASSDRPDGMTVRFSRGAM